MSSGKALILLSVLGLLLVAGFWSYGFLQIDSCLDKGGRWNATVGTCEFVKSGE